jgi:hypothetical protein
VCLAAVPEEERHQFVERLLVPLRELRGRTGRPHWIMVDEAHEILPASAQANGSPSTAAENILYVTSDPTALSPAILRSVDGIAACGDAAAATIDAFAAAVEWGKPALPSRPPRDHEALVWFRRSERPVALIDIARVKEDALPATPENREKSPEVGQVLRRA